MMRDSYDMFGTPERGRFGDNEEGDNRVRGNDSVRSNLVDVAIVIHHGTEKALLVSIDGNEAKAQWLPKSRIEIEHKNGMVTGTKRNGQIVELQVAQITLPQALAREKGLI